MKKIYLHKYMSVEALKAFITYHTIKLSFGYEANDCFEMLQGDAVPSSNKTTEAVEKHGFISLTARKDSPYMWGNYADHYKGARLDLVFEIEEGDINARRYKREDKDEPRYKSLKNIDDIEFEGAYIEKCEYENNRIDKVETKLEECTRNIISNKERSWAQEEEYRIIYSISYANRPSPLLTASPTNNGIIYTTKDINHCIYNIALGPLCEISESDVKCGIMKESTLRGARIEKLHFNKCEYRVSGNDGYDSVNEKIIYLCRAREIDKIKEIKNKINLNYVDNYGSTYLDYAIRCKSVTLFKCLWEEGIHKSCLQDDEVYDALIWSTQHDYCDIVKFLVEKYTEKNFAKCKDLHGRNAIMAAAKNGSVNTFDYLIEKLKEQFSKTDSKNWKAELRKYLNQVDSDGRTALMLASLSKNVYIVTVLLKHGADVSIRDYQNSHAVIFAASAMQTNDDDDSNGAEILALLSHGNDKLLQAEEFQGYSALHYAVNKARTKCISFLLNHGVKVPHNLGFFFSGDKSVMELFYSDDIVRTIMPRLDEIFIKHNIGITEGHTICFLNLYNLVASKRRDYVIDYMSNLLKVYRNDEHLLAIHAAKTGNYNFLHSLLDYHADTNTPNSFSDICSRFHDKGGCTALMWCIDNPSVDDFLHNNRLKCLRFILANINPTLIYIRDFSGATVLTWAARKGNIEAASIIIEYLEKNNISLKDYLMQQDNHGLSILMWAVWKRKIAFVEYIIKIADQFVQDLLDLEDCRHMTILDWGFLTSDERIVKYLLDLKGQNGSSLACHFGHLSPIVDY